MKLLIVNPNSSRHITEAIQEHLSEDVLALFESVTFFTGPHESPAQISGTKTSVQSCKACLPLLLKRVPLDGGSAGSSQDGSGEVFYFESFDAVVVACFSDHPLVHELTKRTEQSTPVVSILEGALNYAVSLGKPFSIITSNEEWVQILNLSVPRVLKGYAGHRLWRGTVTSGLDVLQLHDTRNLRRIADVMRRENIERLKSTVVILGCAGFSGLEPALLSHISPPPSERTIILLDSIVATLKYVSARYDKASLCAQTR
ncbi:Dcg1p Ecym_1027 [Eremothecium cymbalariae DBVPG|uniref:Asp/Glu/hydantoin racemase n=1 Tax=Eremothecium cymbalariae (strain CBS 270.75 / DBVPG 7215 / KCTC 17166 / NRRL Y-17582) TaxID=931890 RepID=G8JM25_ERECY|nr:hypothetical protein Ecym_1027 [Eremothecium cymbalariae DBVPG\